MAHQPRLNYYAAAPGAAATLLGANKFLLEKSSLEHGLLDLVQLRASQVNGCAFCTVLHANDLLDEGETHERLHQVVVWRESQLFSDRERIALEYAEVLTDLTHRDVSDDLYARALAEFGERGIVELTLQIAVINAWNRFGVAFRTAPDPNFRSKKAVASV